jgi:LmbE family N-acetylglucosaminyl deacetylase
VGRILLSGTLEPDVHVDIAGVVDRKVAAVLCHRSQISDPAEVGEVIRNRSEAAGAEVGLGAAESFRLLLLS